MLRRFGDESCLAFPSMWDIFEPSQVVECVICSCPLVGHVLSLKTIEISLVRYLLSDSAIKCRLRVTASRKMSYRNCEAVPKDGEQRLDKHKLPRRPQVLLVSNDLRRIRPINL